MTGRAVELGLWTLLAAGIALTQLGDAPRPARDAGAFAEGISALGLFVTRGLQRGGATR